MGMGILTIFRPRASLCRRDDAVGHNVQAAGNIQYGYRLIHIVALSAMGNKTVMEPDCRHVQH